MALEFKRSLSKISFFSFVTQYNELFSIGSTLKPNRGIVFDFTYKGHITTADSYKTYLESKSTYDSNARNVRPFSHTFTLNAQDADGIGTINTSL